LKASTNIPLESDQNIPLTLVGQSFVKRRRYTRSDEISVLAINHYRKTGKGIIFEDLLSSGLAPHKDQAQTTLKYCLERKVLFTPENTRPQQYYPTCLKSEVMKRIMAKNTPIDPTGVGILPMTHSYLSSSKSPLSQCLQHMVVHTLEGYVLPLLPQAPLFIHNMHLKTKVLPECYLQLDLPYYKGNKGKHYTEIIGRTRVDYVFYSKGTVDIHASCSNNSYKLETEEDHFRIIEFFGQIRAALINLLNDKHERIVDDVLEWELTECDINKDIKVSDLLHFSAIKVQVKHLNHLFSIYIKSMAKDTVCRVEERKHPNQSAIDFINDVFNPIERVERRIAEYGNKLSKIHNILVEKNDHPI